MQFLVAPVWGRLSDRHGRRLPLILGLVGTAGSYLVFAFAGTVWILLLSRMVGGVAGATIPVAQAYVADRSPREGRARAMGLIGAAFGIGFIIGPAMGGFLSRWGYVVPGLVAAGLSLLAAAVAIAFLPESLPPEKRKVPTAGAGSGVRAASEQLRALSTTLGDARFRGPIGATLLANTGIAAYTTIFPLLLEDPIGMTAVEAGIFFTYAGVVSATTQGLLVGPAVDRLGEKRMAVAGSVFVMIALVVLAWAPDTRGILLSLTLLGGGWGFFNPALLGILSARAGDADQGSVLGVNQSAGALARVVGPGAGGWAFGALGYTLAFHAAAALLCLTALWLLGIPERPNGPAVES